MKLLCPENRMSSIIPNQWFYAARGLNESPGSISKYPGSVGCSFNGICGDINTIFYNGKKQLNRIDFEISVVIVR
jgi:hypothetical protein